MLLFNLSAYCLYDLYNEMDFLSSSILLLMVVEPIVPHNPFFPTDVVLVPFILLLGIYYFSHIKIDDCCLFYLATCCSWLLDVRILFFFQDIADAIDEEDVVKFTDVVKEFDGMTPLVKHSHASCYYLIRLSVDCFPCLCVGKDHFVTYVMTLPW